MSGGIATAMVLAAGLGKRMRPLTDDKPKPMIPVGGKTMIDRLLDQLAEAGVARAVVNLHYLADRLEAHLKQRQRPEIQLSHEEILLETGGGVVQALPLLRDPAFFVVNGDVMWLDGTIGALTRLAARWNPAEMDALLLVHPSAAAHGYQGLGDFQMDQIGQLTRRAEGKPAPFVFTGVQILSADLFAGESAVPFSLNRLYDKAIERERLFGLRHQGEWFHIGTPEALEETERLLSDLGFREDAA